MTSLSCNEIQWWEQFGHSHLLAIPLQSWLLPGRLSPVQLYPRNHIKMMKNGALFFFCDRACSRTLSSCRHCATLSIAGSEQGTVGSVELTAATSILSSLMHTSVCLIKDFFSSVELLCIRIRTSHHLSSWEQHARKARSARICPSELLEKYSSCAPTNPPPSTTTTKFVRVYDQEHFFFFHSPFSPLKYGGWRRLTNIL